MSRRALEVNKVDVPVTQPRSAEESAHRPLPRDKRHLLRFGTSGLRGLVKEMTDLEVYVNTRGFLDYLQRAGDLAPGDDIALAEDLRERDPVSGLSSSPRIARAVAHAIRDAGFGVVHCGTVPTPALAYYAMDAHVQAGKQSMPAIMVTGSHIPADRNGVKFYRKGGEVLKADEPGILACVAAVRSAEYIKDTQDSLFDSEDMLKSPAPLPPVDAGAARAYVSRYIGLFPGAYPLRGQRIVLFEQSAVGRDLIRHILEALGAEVIPVERSDTFVSIDTENVTETDRARFREFVARYHPDAIVSTDGDGDRPFVIDEKGCFHPGDTLGLVAADFLEARFAAVPVSVTDAIDRWAERRTGDPSSPSIAVEKTRIGSPHVIEAITNALARGATAVVGWEANGGFLTATDFEVNGHILKALPTRDAMLPILAALLLAAERTVTVSKLFAALPQRATSAGLIDDLPLETSGAIVTHFSPPEPGVVEVAFGESSVTISRGGLEAEETLPVHGSRARALCEARERLLKYFTEDEFGPIVHINYLDGVRVFFANGDIAHLRPSGNAPQLRLYAVSDKQERAEQLVQRAIREPNGLFRRMASDLAAK